MVWTIIEYLVFTLVALLGISAIGIIIFVVYAITASDNPFR